MSTATILSANPSKQDEIAHYTEFVSSLPESCYLADILHGTTGSIGSMITADIAHPLNLSTLQRECGEVYNENLILRREKAQLASDVKDLRDEERRLRSSMRDIRNTADVISREIAGRFND